MLCSVYYRRGENTRWSNGRHRGVQGAGCDPAPERGGPRGEGRRHRGRLPLHPRGDPVHRRRRSHPYRQDLVGALGESRARLSRPLGRPRPRRPRDRRRDGPRRHRPRRRPALRDHTRRREERALGPGDEPGNVEQSGYSPQRRDLEKLGPSLRRPRRRAHGLRGGGTGGGKARRRGGDRGGRRRGARYHDLALAQVVLQRLLGAREGQLGPGQPIAGELFYVERLVQGLRLAAYLPRGEDGDGRDLTFVGVQADDPADLYLQPRLLERLARGGFLGDLAPLDESSGEGPPAVAGLDGALYQDYSTVELDDGPGHQLRPQVEDEAAPLAHQPLRFAFFEEARFEASGAAGTESVFRRYHRTAFKSARQGSTVSDGGSSVERFACSPDTPPRNAPPGCAPRSGVCRPRSPQRRSETRPEPAGNPGEQPHPGARRAHR